jgi:histidinol dehydrogenase
MPRGWKRMVQPGVRVGQIVRPLGAVGCYIPGGRHPLPSSVLMTAIPARVAGVERIVAASPKPADAVLGAAHLAGVTEMYQVGGAQAIAALAYGTATLARVDKIVGPGNSYVTAAKHLVRADCAIDFLAGPTEVLIVAKASSDPASVAADLLAQAEHDPEAVAWLVTTSRNLADAVNAALASQFAATPNPIAATALRARGAALITRTLRSALALSNRIAPEHLTVPAEALDWVTNAGSVFVGDWAPQAAGDYLTGTNHVLPTGGEARACGGLSVMDFVKIITVQQPTRAGLQALAPAITALAASEGLPAHAASVTIRAVRRPR